MRKTITKLLSGAVCAALLMCGTGGMVYAADADKKDSTKISLLAEKEEADLTKDETVYVLVGADGSVDKIIVSDWIKNTVGSSTVSDRSELTDVENVRGGESYVMNGDNLRVWDARGNDIYYQGTADKELPVSISVSYQLDGKSISPADLAGKSGRVTIRFEYRNNQYEMVEIDGEKVKMYVPFAMLTGMLLDNDIFTNVAVTNGKLLNDGSRMVVVGMAFPGLKDNLNLDEDKLEIPDYVEITADVTNFELANTVTIAANEFFSRLNTDKPDSTDGLTASLDSLTEAMSQLTDGSSALYDGLCTLLEKAGGLVSGIDQLAAGAAGLKDGALKLDSGIEALSDGAEELAGGLGALTSNNDTLNAGSKQVFESLLSMADSQLAAAGLSVPKLTIENYSQVLDNIMTALGGGNTVQENPAAASLAALKAQLDSYNQFYIGLQQYTAGVASAKAGADRLNAGAGQLKSGTSELSSGMNELYEGILTLKDGAPALIDGITQLRDGAMQLSDGLKEFDEKGIQKLVDAVDGDMESLFTRLRATADVSKDYNSFSGLSDDMAGQVKFIYRTEAVKTK